LPIILLTIFWRRFNTAGAVTGMLVGLFSSLILVAISPNVWNPEPGAAILVGEALFPLTNPGVVSIPLGFIAAFIGTILSSKKEDAKKFDEIVVKANTGLGVSGVSNH
jgi:cation/acetate symporter